MAAVEKRKIKLREVNRHLVCRLCRGYYVDATTIAECLHSFCRSCIIKYLEKNSFCPVCEVQIHTAKPYLSLRQDKALQDVVYKLVPGLYRNEMRRRRDFYTKHPEQIPSATPEQCGLEDRIIFSPDDPISFSLEFLEKADDVFHSISSRGSSAAGNARPAQQGVQAKAKSGAGKVPRRKAPQDGDTPARSKKYLQGPGAVIISHLKKFVRMKCGIEERVEVDIIYKRVSLPDHYTLMDVAYIYTWKRSKPMRFFYYFSDERRKGAKVSEAEMYAKLPLEWDAPGIKKETEDYPAGVVNGAESVHALELPVGQAVIVLPVPKIEDFDKFELCEKPDVNGSETKSLTDAEKGLVAEPTSGCPDSVLLSADSVKQESESERGETGEAAEAKAETETEANANASAEKTHPSDVSQDDGSPIKVNTSSLVPCNNNNNNNNNNKEAKQPEAAREEHAEEKLNKKIATLLRNYRKAYEARLKTREAEKHPAQEREVAEGEKAEAAESKKAEAAEERKESGTTIEIRSEAKASEYDFESSSPPEKIVSLREFTKSERCKSSRKTPNENGRMSLQDFRKVMKENEKADAGDRPKIQKVKTMPCLKRIDENKRSPVQKSLDAADGKRNSPTVINIRTVEEDYKRKEGKAEASDVVSSTVDVALAPTKKDDDHRARQSDENDKPHAKEAPEKQRKRQSPDSEATETPKKSKPEEVRSDSCGAMDLSKSDAGKKSDENIMEALVSAAQKQSIEPLLRVPQFLKQSGSPTKVSPGRNISPRDISQALQFFKDLRSDIRVLESKSHGGSQSEPFAAKMGSAAPYQIYQQQMELIKRLKKQQQQIMAGGDYQPQPKLPKLSPPPEKQKTSPGGDAHRAAATPTKEDATQVKSSVERTLTQIQEQFEIQNRMKNSLKNLPALLHFYNRPPFLYCPPGVSSPKPNQSRMKSPSLPSNSQKSPKSPKSPGSYPPLPVSGAGSSLFNNQSYAPIVNSGLTSEMTFHQMFQNYLSQQEKLNQMKPPLQMARPRQGGSAHPGASDFYWAGKPEAARSPPKQKT